MPECDYCGASFDDEDAELDHLAAEHEGELGRIDQRRVDAHRSDDGFEIPPTAIYAVGGLALLALVGVTLYYVVGVFSSPGVVHEHGTIEVTVDGDPVGLHQYSNEREAFHFHPGDPQWHMEPSEPGRLTLRDALGRIGIELTETRLAFPDRTYDASQPGTELAIEVNDESVTPSYTLRDGDHVRIAVQTNE